MCPSLPRRWSTDLKTIRLRPVLPHYQPYSANSALTAATVWPGGKKLPVKVFLTTVGLDGLLLTASKQLAWVKPITFIQLL